MKTIKVSEATTTQLDWLVAKIEDFPIQTEGYYNDELDREEITKLHGCNVFGRYASDTEWSPSTIWDQGGEIIEREGIDISVHVIHNGVITSWAAGSSTWPSDAVVSATGATPLIAVMRCYVSSQLGLEVELPDVIQ